MQPGLLIRLRPVGPWRYGPGDGGHDRVDANYRSDRLYSAVTLAMRQLGSMEEWLDATARAEQPAVVFSSLFPFQGDTLFAVPPATLWPPPANLVTTPSPVFLTKIRWSTARFVPLSVIDSLLTGQPILADQWQPDPESGCLLRRDRPNASPFRVGSRSTAAVDRITRSGDEVSSLACVEFEPGAGLWTVARFHDAEADAKWNPHIRAAFRVLSDSGFGGGRTRGWGQTQAAEFQPGIWPNLLLPKAGRLPKTEPGGANGGGAHSLYWLLSLYSPAKADTIDWSGGDYRLAVRAGRVENGAASGVMKRQVRMVTEGCVLAADKEPIGRAIDVAPEGFAHPVYRSGMALALRLPPPRVHREEERAIEEPATAEAAIKPAAELIAEAAEQPVEQAAERVSDVEPSRAPDAFENTEAHDLPVVEEEPQPGEEPEHEI